MIYSHLSMVSDIGVGHHIKGEKLHPGILSALVKFGSIVPHGSHAMSYTCPWYLNDLLASFPNNLIVIRRLRRSLSAGRDPYLEVIQIPVREQIPQIESCLEYRII